MYGSETSKSEFRSFTFPCKKLPVHHHSETIVDELIAAQQPVIITGTDLAAPAMKWNLQYLSEHMGNGKLTVYQTRDHCEKFKYFDEKKKVDGFVPPMKQVQMTFKEFHESLKCQPRGLRHYLQEPLTDKVGSGIVEDFVKFNWKWARGQQLANNWGPLTTNLLLVSQEGNITPCHYDEQENLYSQVVGVKRVILFPPEQFECLYPHPVYHPHDRQTQVDFDNPDFKKFPNFKKAEGLEAVLKPGDVLYLPSYWFHYFETPPGMDYAVSLTFWYKAAPVGTITHPLKPVQKMAMMRNIEKMISEALGNHREVDPFWQTLVMGRYVPVVSEGTVQSWKAEEARGDSAPFEERREF